MLSVERQRRRLQLTARVALVGWVFALAVGVANACLLQVRPAGAIVVWVDAPPAVPVHSAHEATDAHAGHDAGAGHDGRANCMKFCADESSTLAKDGTKPFDLPQPALVDHDRHVRHDDVAEAARAAYRLPAPPDRPRPSLVVLLLRRTT